MRDITGELIPKLKKADPSAILKHTDDGAYYYVFSPDRMNAFRFFPFDSGMTVLLEGACYGVFAPLAERVKRLDVHDASQEALEVIALRSPQALEENGGRLRLLSAYSGADYDVILLPLMDLRFEEEPDVLRLVRELLRYLKEDGSLIIAADNANALRFFSGSEKETGICYPSLQELGEIRALGFEDEKLYYPLPDAGFAKSLFSEARLPGEGDFRGIGRSLGEERVTLVNEETAYPALAKAGVFRNFAPSYVAFFGGFHREAAENAVPTGKAVRIESSALPDYVRFNSGRRDAFALKTEIFTDKDGSRRVVKTALSPAANDHIDAFRERLERLTGGSGQQFEILRPELGKTADGLSYAAFDYIDGVTLDRQLIAAARDGKLAPSRIREALELVIGDESRICHNLDAVFDNVICSWDKYYLLDYEWVFGERLDREYVKYRILRYFYEHYEKELYGYRDMGAFLKENGLAPELFRELQKKEDSFQSYVFGGEKAELEQKFLKPAGDVETIKEALKHQSYYSEQNRRLKEEIREHKTALKKEREVERLSQNHIRNLETIIDTQKQQLANAEKQLSFMHRHLSLFGRLYIRFIAWLDKAAPQGSKGRKTVKYVKNWVLHPLRSARLFFTEEGKLIVRGDYEVGGELAEGGILEVPQTETPLVSIVIPVYNQVGYTYACIRSILLNTDFEKTPYEIILADDVSTDATKEIDTWIKGLVISRAEENQGFLLNCNRGAGLARGRYIFFLNNDTKVREHWLDSLTGLMDGDESIGLSGSKLIYPDGRLQEAGGIIWSDGSGWNYGRLDDPEKSEYNYVKEVDYISGAAIMIRRSLWEELGGFDARFAPAYCEDSDLAFQVRQAGYRVVYQPRSVVVHYEGVSNGTDVEGSGLKRYQKVNQEKFREKWAEELKKQSENNGNPNPFAARERSQNKQTILVIDHYVPQWDRDAGSRTTYQYIRMFLRKGFRVKFAGDNFLREEPYASILEQMGVEVLYGDVYRADIYEWIRKNQAFIDFAYLNRPHVAIKYLDFLKSETNIKCIYYGHDLHYLRLRREYELSGDEEKKREAEYWHSLEFSVMEDADMVYYPSETEIEAIRKERPVPARAITAYLWEEMPETAALLEQPADAGQGAEPGQNAAAEQNADGPAEKDAQAPAARSGLLFVGGFAHSPNADGLLWFAQKVWPAVRRALPELQLYVAGSHVTEEIQALDGDGIHILGFVPDEELDRLYRETRLVVVPLRYGAGVKGKVVEALYHGGVCVTTSVGAEGIPEAEKALCLVNGEDEEIREQPEAVEARFAAEIIRLYGDVTERNRLREAAAELIRAHYSLDAAWSVIAADFGREA